ncbi:hypothetical protein ACLBYD_28700 [Rhodococcus sp. C26F]
MKWTAAIVLIAEIADLNASYPGLGNALDHPAPQTHDPVLGGWKHPLR